jgi:hypothetical protein
MSVPIKLTNLLGNVLGSYEFVYDPSKKTVVPPVSKDKFYVWEAQLSQCSYLSRAVYCPSELFLRAIQFLEYTPDVMNDVITQLERSFYIRNDFKELFISKTVPTEATHKHGMFFPKTGCAIFQHHNPTSKINNKKILYVVFKGSSSFRDFMNDAKVAPIQLKDIPELNNLKGFTHFGFYKHMKDEVRQVLETVKNLAVDCEHVYITGHSLGGAMATIFSLMVVNRSITDKPVHCISLGAPNLFSDDARNEFNTFLLNRKLTFDRVSANGDIVVSIPGVRFSHPGFGILKTELYATSKTGRAKNIGDIRSVFLGSDTKVSNDIPTDPVFFGLFQQWSGPPKRLKSKEFITFVIPDIAVTEKDITPDATPEEQKAEAESIQQETAGIEKLVGGAIFTSEGKDIYAKQTLSQFPNQVNYVCKFLPFCHASYLGIGYVAAVRVPTIRGVGIVRKKEPDQITTFMSTSTDMNPANRYYAVVQRLGGLRRRRKTRKFRHAYRRTRKVRV